MRRIHVLTSVRFYYGFRIGRARRAALAQAEQVGRLAAQEVDVGIGRFGRQPAIRVSKDSRARSFWPSRQWAIARKKPQKSTSP